jgi:hypothetical protein
MRQFGRRTLEELPVLPAGESMKPVGAIGRQDVINAYNKEILKMDLGGAMSARINSVSKLRSWETVGGYLMTLMEVPPHLCGKELEVLQLRQKQGIQVILIERGGEKKSFSFPARDSVLNPGDRVIVFGRREDVQRFT